MNKIITSGIVLTRTNYQESDRIVTFITPNHGKVRAIVRGARNSKSKLAGGVELFSVSEIGFIQGRGGLATLVLARLIKHYSLIVQDIDRTMLGYELIKLLNTVTEDHPEEEYFELLQHLFEALNESQITTQLIKLWFNTQLLRQAGHTPNLHTEITGQPLVQDRNYAFSYDDMAFLTDEQAYFGTDHIKFLRLVFSGNSPRVLQQVAGVETLISPCLNIIQKILPAHIRV